jgi:hypothetical protein
MERVRFMEHSGERILFIDFSGCENAAQVLAVADEAKPIISAQEEKTLLTLTDVTGVTADGDMATALWELLRHNKPYVRAGAVVGVEDEHQETLYQLLTHQARRDLPAFATVEEAKDWLVSGES